MPYSLGLLFSSYAQGSPRHRPISRRPPAITQVPGHPPPLPEALAGVAAEDLGIPRQSKMPLAEADAREGCAATGIRAMFGTPMKSSQLQEVAVAGGENLGDVYEQVELLGDVDKQVNVSDVVDKQVHRSVHEGEEVHHSGDVDEQRQIWDAIDENKQIWDAFDEQRKLKMLEEKKKK